MKSIQRFAIRFSIKRGKNLTAKRKGSFRMSTSRYSSRRSVRILNSRPKRSLVVQSEQLRDYEQRINQSRREAVCPNGSSSQSNLDKL